VPLLSISFYIETEDDKPWAPDGPGWYADARRPGPNGGVEVIPRVRMSPEEMEQLAKVFDNFMSGKELNWAEDAERDPTSVHTAVVRATEHAKVAIATSLAEAESRVRRLEALRRRAKEFGVDESNPT
jgi:hypothetical protein